MNIPACVLAAGESRRFRRGNKLLSPFRGRPLIAHVLGTVLQADLEPVLVVLGHEAEVLEQTIRSHHADSRLRFVFNPRYREGHLSSLHAAMDALPTEAPGLMVFLGDMPQAGVALASTVRQRFMETGKVVFPLVRGRKGHPVAIPRALFGPIRGMRADARLQPWFFAHPECCAPLNWPDDSILLDVDTPADFASAETNLLPHRPPNGKEHNP